MCQLLAARMEIGRLCEENSRFRSMLTHLTTEYHNLQMHVVTSVQRHSDSLNRPVNQSSIAQVNNTTLKLMCAECEILFFPSLSLSNRLVTNKVFFFGCWLSV